ncbi:MAG: arginine--tRNA ligase [Chitinophagaceae bacterium]|nr:arginine--tRNA ligase [Chitinophagaceae bacterium]
MAYIDFIRTAVQESLEKLYGNTGETLDIQITPTKPEFEGDYTVVFFSLLKVLKKRPDELGNQLGEKLLELYPDTFAGFNVIKGFLNLTFTHNALTAFLKNNYGNEGFGRKPETDRTVMVEYASPNTNKPLHLGHLRNIFLGWSMAEILEANGFKVVKSSIINDRGIHICKSMIAWKLFAGGATPESTEIKGDHFVGDYYVKFNDVYQEQIAELVAGGMDKKQAEKEAPIMKEAQDMLLKWEQGDEEVRSLWAMMNGWVYEGFDSTYKRIGVDFDKVYYESDTYLLGKEYVQKGLEENILFKKPDGSVWIDLADVNLDEKLLLRGDGTSVYMTQDIGLAVEKYKDYPLEKSIYVIGDEQLYHMKVLKEICRKLGFSFADEIFHLSYGMVELTTGKMKSREGTVVDADDIVEEMVQTAATLTAELGKVEGSTEEELKQLYETLGLGAMKFYLLRVDPKKRMVFDPKESIDFHGFTGPFVQYTYARIRSILRKSALRPEEITIGQDVEYEKLERELTLLLETYPNVLADSARDMNPSLIAGYVFSVAQLFNSFYTEHSVLKAESSEKQNLRLALSVCTANILKSALHLLGISVPDRM